MLDGGKCRRMFDVMRYRRDQPVSMWNSRQERYENLEAGLEINRRAYTLAIESAAQFQSGREAQQAS